MSGGRDGRKERREGERQGWGKEGGRAGGPGWVVAGRAPSSAYPVVGRQTWWW